MTAWALAAGGGLPLTARPPVVGRATAQHIATTQPAQAIPAEATADAIRPGGTAQTFEVPSGDRNEEAYDAHMCVSAAEMEKLRELVMVHWDPVGVHLTDDPDARARCWDEYDAYLPTIAEHLRSRDGVNRLADYLAGVRTLQMGLPARRDSDLKVAAAIIAWYDGARQRY